MGLFSVLLTNRKACLKLAFAFFLKVYKKILNQFGQAGVFHTIPSKLKVETL